MPDDVIIIRQPDNHITVESTPTEVSVAAPGPPGPPGPQGPPGAAGGEIFEFTQASPVTPWVINHTLDCFPDVTCIVSGEEVYPDVVYGSETQVTLVFSSPAAGTARLRP